MGKKENTSTQEIETVHQSGKENFLKLQGALTIYQAEELKGRFVETVGKTDKVIIDVGDVTEIDLPCLQLFCSAHRTSLGLGKSFRIAGNRSPVLREFLHNAGYDHHAGCASQANNQCPWKGGENE